MSGPESGAQAVIDDIEVPDGVHFDHENVELFHAAATLAPVRPGDRVLVLGCGTGLWGLLAAHSVDNDCWLTMTDIHAPSVEIAARNAAAAGIPSARCAAYCGDMFAAVPNGDYFDVILFNPPQSGGPPGFRQARPDKYGGDDGAWFYLEFAKTCRPFMAPGCRLLVSQHGLANPDKVREAFLARSFGMTILAEQERRLSRSSLDSIFPGLFQYQLDQVARGEAQILSRSALKGSVQVAACGSRDKGGTASGGPGGLLIAGARAEGIGAVQRAAGGEEEEKGEESFTIWQRVFLVTAEQSSSS